jgi:two-component system, OmpR family, sensor histidine kinase VicK
MKFSFRISSFGLVAVSIIPGLILIALAEFIVGIQKSTQEANQRKALNSSLINLSSQLQQEMNAAVYFSMGLKAYIETNQGNFSESQIAPWLTNLQVRGQHIRNIGIAPGNRISYIYPLAGNEAALGLYYPDMPVQWPAVKEVIDTRKAKLIGPFPLTQGGQGFVYREPIYLGDDSYWGMISTVLDADGLLAAVAQRAQVYDVSIQVKDEATQTLIYDQGEIRNAVTEKQFIHIPGRDISIAVYHAKLEMPLYLHMVQKGGWLVGVVTSLLLLFFLQALRERKKATNAFRESQLRFERAFSFSPQGMAIVDDKEQWLEVNPALCSMLKTSKVQIEQKKIEELFSAQDQFKLTQIRANLRNAITTGESLYEQFETQLHLDEKNVLNVLVSIGICYHYKKTIHWILQIVDISERIKLEQMKSEFVSTVSHELRTPLTSITGALGMVTAGSLGEVPAKADQVLQIAYKNSQRLGLLINDLLDMEKLLAGKMTFDLQLHSLDGLIEQALKDNQSYADKLGINFQYLNKIGAVNIKVDSLRFAQVMSNLLSNAAKFSPKGESVEIVLLQQNDQVRIEVKDKGPGIPDEFRKRIFQKFSQADSSDTRQKSGTGLGLAIVKELVDRMGGEVGYETEVGKGSCFFTVWGIVR